MRIYRNDKVYQEVTVPPKSTGCYITEEVAGEHTLTLTFSLLKATTFEINDYVVFEGNNYYIRYNESITKTETSLGYDYVIIFYHIKYTLNDKAFFRHGRPERLKSGNMYTGSASEVLDLIITNANRNSSGWTKGSCVDVERNTFDFTDKSVLDVLEDVVSQYNTEYWVDGNTIHIGKREFESGGLVLSQGEGGGLVDLQLKEVERTPPTTVLYPYGSDKNLYVHDYGSDFLLLPDGQQSLEMNVSKYGRIEKQMAFPDIFPQGTFEITEVVDIHIFKAAGIDFDIKTLFIDGQTPIVTFQTGALAGYDLDIKDGGWNNTTKQITVLENKEETALEVPGDINFAVGDKFILTNIRMPQTYIDEAEKKLLEEATAWLEKNCEKKVSVSGTCDDNKFRKDGITIACGQMVGIYSEKLEINREIRCIRTKRYLESDEATTPFRYEITLSDFLNTASIKDRITDLEKLPDKIKNTEEQSKSWFSRSWRDIKELSAALPGMFDEFGEAINPVSVNAMQMYMGAENLQYKFVASKTSEPEIYHEFRYNASTKVFSTNGGWIRHMTIGIDTLKPSHALSEHKHWLISSFESAPLLDRSEIWLYIKASKSNETATFMLSKDKIADDSSHYYFVVGFLNSEYNGERSWTSLYGWSELTPGMMRVNRVSSTNGSNYMDLLAEMFRVGDNNTFLGWNINGDRTLRTKGIIVQSPSGDESPIGVLVGAYSSSRQYYEGDEVTYNGSTYRALRGVRGVVPTNTASWIVVAQRGGDGSSGRDGVDGQGYRYIYYPTTSLNAPSTPSGTGTSNPSSWWTYPYYPSSSYKYIYVSQSICTNGVWSTWSPPTIYSRNEQGLPGALPTMRQWTSGTTYYRNEKTVDYIVYRASNSATPTWWRLREGYTSAVAGNAPSTSYFEQITSFEAIATTVLLAEQANLAEFIFKEGQLVSQTMDSGVPRLSLNGRTGAFHSSNASIRGRVESNANGNRIVINPGTNSIDMINSSDRLVGKISFENTAGAQSVPKMELFLYRADGSLFSTATYGAGAATMTLSNGNSTRLGSGVLSANALPTIDPRIRGEFWRDGTTVKVSLG
jgi:Carbohydrate binding domain.